MTIGCVLAAMKNCRMIFTATFSSQDQTSIKNTVSLESIDISDKALFSNNYQEFDISN
jgi:hypothetical protein